MYDSILFPTDGGEGATAVFDHVLDLAARHDATVHVLNVVDTTHDTVTRVGGTLIDALEREGEAVVAAAAERAAERGVSTVTDVVPGAIAAAVTDYAAGNDVDLVAMPTHGRTGLDRLLLGSVTERVLRTAPVPVLALRPDEDAIRYPFRNVLVPTDGSDCAAAALDHGIGIAAETGATLHALSVVDVASLGADVHSQVQVETLEADARAVVESATETAEAAGVESVAGSVEAGSSVHRAIGSYAEDHDVDLVAMGTHGRSGLDRVLLGSVTEKTLRTAPAPVLVVPDR
jgi:nucleotide-binding universal stress UspA family protein